tara:strand:+ start:50 stop:922 length:873 start_codon:yes stop_codon:yes gene_type:complete
MYFDEDVVLDVRLNLLNEHVHKFVIIESIFNHKGEKRKPQFDIDKFSKFKEKIIYILKDDVPSEIETIGEQDSEKEVYRKSILNALKRENLQRNSISEGLIDARPDDWIIISDLDEIPKLEKLYFDGIKEKILIFEQEMMYYKFNLKLENFTWMGSKACKFKFLESPQWLRNIKGRKFNWWRIDTFFSKKKYKSIKFIKDGGWHYSYLKTPKEIEKKLKSYLHHIEYDINPLGLNKIENIIKDKKTIYDLKVDQRKNKFDARNELVKIQNNQLPKYILDNLDKYNNWIEK